jgi:hypothetical protein
MRVFTINSGPGFEALCDSLLHQTPEKFLTAARAEITLIIREIEKEDGNKGSLIISGYITRVLGCGVDLITTFNFKGWYDPKRRCGNIREIKEDHLEIFA